MELYVSTIWYFNKEDKSSMVQKAWVCHSADEMRGKMLRWLEGNGNPKKQFTLLVNNVEGLLDSGLE